MGSASGVFLTGNDVRCGGHDVVHMSCTRYANSGCGGGDDDGDDGICGAQSGDDGDDDERLCDGRLSCDKGLLQRS